MKLQNSRIMIFALTGVLFLTLSPVFAETVIFKSGKTVEGKIIEKTDKYIKIDIEGVAVPYFLNEIKSIDDNPINDSPKNVSSQQSKDIKEVNITPEKKALISELFVSLDMEKPYNDVTDKILSQIKLSTLERIANLLAANKNISSEQKEQMRKQASETWDRILARYKELLPQRINLKDEIEQIAYSLYGKHFSVEELRDIVDFYKSPTGRKTREALPQIMSESMQEFQERIGPISNNIFQEIFQEEKKRNQQSKE